MLRTLILPAVEPPYLVIEIVAALYHLTVLPAEFGDDDLEAIARAQVRANRLDACVVLGERRVLAIDAEGVERRETEVPFRERRRRSEEHTSELQSLTNLVCRLLLEKKKKKK